MKLSEQEVQRFYHIWFNLLNYVNERRAVSPTFAAAWRGNQVKPEEAAKIRDVLWADDSLREGFIADNPADLGDADLALVVSWQHRVRDNFFIARYLKNHAVFIGSDNRGYGVHGITDSIEEMTGGFAPIYVTTVLIPFEGRIIYDSLFALYNVVFGSGYRSSLKDAYRDIQERGGVITQLPAPALSPDTVRAGNKKVLTAFKRELRKAGLSPQKVDEHFGQVAAFADTLTPSVFLVDTTPTLLSDYETQNVVNPVSFKRFVRFLRDTGRMDWDESEALMAAIKRWSS